MDRPPPPADGGPPDSVTGAAAASGAAGPPDAVAAAPGLRPVETDTARIVAFGTGVFAVAFVILLVLRATAPDWSAGHPAWLWTALAGWLLGLAGLALVTRHRRQGRTR